MFAKKTHRFAGRTVLIVGATGGLGAAYARAFAAEGAQVLLAARRREALHLLAEALGAPTFALDLMDAAQIQQVAASITAAYPNLSIVINATGYDVRKPLEQHTLSDVDQSLSVTLRGSILLTQAFLPHVQLTGQGMIVHMGGFADGRLAFPFYSVDVATRAGLRGFIDAVNRETQRQGVIVSYFSPGPADTEAERPFHALWRQLGTPIATPEAVAQELLETVAHRKPVYVMGGVLTRFFARLNTVFPTLADVLVMNTYHRHLKAFLTGASEAEPSSKPAGSSRTWGLIFIVLSGLLYGIGLFVLPFAPLEAALKVVMVPATIAVGEASFWVGVAFVGREIVNKYLKYVNPCYWCGTRPA